MVEMTVYKTQDGIMHTSYDAARRHIDKWYADQLCTLSNKMVQIGKYVDMCDFIDKNLDDFIALKAIKRDMILFKEGGEDPDESNSGC